MVWATLIARSTSASVCLAVKLKRSRLVPVGTVGGRMGATCISCVRNSRDAARASCSLPSTQGTMGPCPRTSQPLERRAARKRSPIRTAWLRSAGVAWARSMLRRAVAATVGLMPSKRRETELDSRANRRGPSSQPQRLQTRRTPFPRCQPAHPERRPAQQRAHAHRVQTRQGHGLRRRQALRHARRRRAGSAPRSGESASMLK